MFMLEPMPMPIPTAKPISEPMPMLMFMLMFMLMIMLMGYACAHGNASAYVLLIFDVYPKFFHAREISASDSHLSKTCGRFPVARRHPLNWRPVMALGA